MVIQIVRRSTTVYHERKTDSEKFESDAESSCEKFKEEAEVETEECHVNSVKGIITGLVFESPAVI